uniref:Uncharacterized protein n=1 Tax=Parascaris equorum TaxID=6256 RepID=A0A914R968_PAREQ
MSTRDQLRHRYLNNASHRSDSCRGQDPAVTTRRTRITDVQVPSPKEPAPGAPLPRCPSTDINKKQYQPSSHASPTG